MSETDEDYCCYISMKLPGVFLSPCWGVSLSKCYQPWPALLSLVLSEDRSKGVNPSMGSIACVASVSVEQRAKKRGLRRFARAKNGARAKIRRRGWGRGRKETLVAKHCDFQNRPLGLSCLTDFTLSSSSIQVAFVILVLARFEILDHLIFPSTE